MRFLYFCALLNVSTVLYACNFNPTPDILTQKITVKGNYEYFEHPHYNSVIVGHCINEAGRDPFEGRALVFEDQYISFVHDESNNAFIYFTVARRYRNIENQEVSYTFTGRLPYPGETYIYGGQGKFSAGQQPIQGAQANNHTWSCGNLWVDIKPRQYSVFSDEFSNAYSPNVIPRRSQRQVRTASSTDDEFTSFDDLYPVYRLQMQRLEQDDFLPKPFGDHPDDFTDPKYSWVRSMIARSYNFYEFPAFWNLIKDWAETKGIIIDAKNRLDKDPQFHAKIQQILRPTNDHKLCKFIRAQAARFEKELMESKSSQTSQSSQFVQRFYKSYAISAEVQSFLEAISLDKNMLNSFYGSDEQQDLHQKTVTVFSQTACLYFGNSHPHIKQFTTTIGQVSAIAYDCNRANQVEYGEKVIAFASSLVELGIGLCEGGINCVYRTTHTVAALGSAVVHPLESAHRLGVGLIKVASCLRDLGIAVVDPDKRTEFSKSFIAGLDALASSMQNMSARDWGKLVGEIGTDLVIGNRLLGLTGKLIAVARTQATAADIGEVVLGRLAQSVCHEALLDAGIEAAITGELTTSIKMMHQFNETREAVAPAMRIMIQKFQVDYVKSAALSGSRSLVKNMPLVSPSRLKALSTVYSNPYEARKKLEILVKLEEMYNDVKPWTCAELANRKIKFDLDHIFLLEGKWKQVTINGRVQEVLREITGLHSDFGEKLARNSNLIMKKVTEHSSGVYEARVGLAGIFKGRNSTFFPKIWDEEKVIQKVLEATSSIVEPAVKKTSELVLIGQVAEGFKVRMFVDYSGKIKSVYPI